MQHQKCSKTERAFSWRIYFKGIGEVSRVVWVCCVDTPVVQAEAIVGCWERRSYTVNINDGIGERALMKRTSKQCAYDYVYADSPEENEIVFYEDPL